MKNVIKDTTSCKESYLKGGMEVNICSMNYFMLEQQMAKRSNITSGRKVKGTIKPLNSPCPPFECLLLSNYFPT